jgi:tetratricopeptide (TPR) repeat protein
MQQISQAMSYSGKVTHTEFARPDDTTLPFHAAYDYEREKNGDWDNLRILPQLSPVGMADVDEKDLPVRPIELGTPHTETSHAVMRLPKGWRADLPAAVHAKSAFATLDKTYTFEDGVLTTDRRLVILAPFVPAADWKTYHQWFKDAGLDGENYIQLYRGSSIVGGSSTTFRFPAKSGSGSSTELQFSAHEDNPAAAQLLVEAMKALQANDWDTAKSKLDQAKALTPKDPRLAAGYGILDAHNQKIDNAIADFQQAIAEQPNATRVYRALAQYQLKNGKLDDALLTMRSAIDHNPGDEPSILYLAYLYTQRGDPHAAAAALREGLATLPDDVAIQLRLGDALLQDGKAAEGVPLLKAILETSQDPGQLNDAAYTLANASLELPLAENAVRHALDLFDTASNNGETGPPALARTNLITDTWDTLGWTLYREDKPAEAEPWVRASWRHNNDAEPGYHLALILEALHRPDDAREQIELASAGSTASGAVKHLIQARQKELHADTVKANPTLALQRLRTYNVPRNGIKSSGNGYATVELELTATGTAAVHLIEGDPSLRALYPVIQQLNLDLPFPPGSQAKLLRHGVLSCHSETECQLVLISTADALTQ